MHTSHATGPLCVLHTWHADMPNTRGNTTNTRTPYIIRASHRHQAPRAPFAHQYDTSRAIAIHYFVNFWFLFSPTTYSYRYCHCQSRKMRLTFFFVWFPIRRGSNAFVVVANCIDALLPNMRLRAHFISIWKTICAQFWRHRRHRQTMAHSHNCYCLLMTMRCLSWMGSFTPGQRMPLTQYDLLSLSISHMQIHKSSDYPIFIHSISDWKVK